MGQSEEFAAESAKSDRLLATTQAPIFISLDFALGRSETV